MIDLSKRIGTLGWIICTLTGKHKRGKFLETYGPDDAPFKLRITVCPRCGKRTARKVKKDAA